MTEPDLGDSPPPDAGSTPERRRSVRPAFAPPGRRGNALFPHHPAGQASSPSRFRRLVHELISEPRNWIPFGLMIVLGIVAAGLFLNRAEPIADPRGELNIARLTVSSSRSGTSLFVNGGYVGEIGPAPREFTLAPGHLRLRLVRRDCLARDTAIDLKIGDQVAIGPLEPTCTGR